VEEKNKGTTPKIKRSKANFFKKQELLSHIKIGMLGSDNSCIDKVLKQYLCSRRVAEVQYIDGTHKPTARALMIKGWPVEVVKGDFNSLEILSYHGIFLCVNLLDSTTFFDLGPIFEKVKKTGFHGELHLLGVYSNQDPESKELEAFAGLAESFKIKDFHVADLETDISIKTPVRKMAELIINSVVKSIDVQDDSARAEAKTRKKCILQ
jgi:hypothetical protein